VSRTVRVLIVDDQQLFRDGLRTLLETRDDIEVVGEANDGISGVIRARSSRPDVILMDLRMPQLDGVGATREIHRENPSARILVLTTFDEDEQIFDALRSGAAGYLLKDTPLDQLIEAIHTVMRGETFLQPSVASKVVAELTRLGDRSVRRLLDPLSDRELQILRLLAMGRSNREIAIELEITEGTVKNHLTNIYGKLDVDDRTKAALRARDLGLFD
jgi:DNA-binding NarL/FixJ family response regulator